ncbi:interleukin-8-like isoform X1 [Lynx canadensis]|uniref:interleukin-8-like isoform X1 n=1 Tax=Lynx canadensis TaxID=61383 RepID=UPI0011B048C4|nr:interleukin-8-like isoform X1 [Lynx canadensis]
MAAESSQRRFLLLAVFALSIFANLCEGQELRCQCIQTHSDFISLKFIKHVQLIPEGVHCSRKEIMNTNSTNTKFAYPVHCWCTFGFYPRFCDCQHPAYMVQSHIGRWEINLFGS